MTYEESNKITEEFFKNVTIEEIIEHLEKNGIKVTKVDDPKDAGLVILPNPKVDYDFCMNDDDEDYKEDNLLLPELDDEDWDNEAQGIGMGEYSPFCDRESNAEIMERIAQSKEILKRKKIRKEILKNLDIIVDYVMRNNRIYFRFNGEDIII